MPNEQVRWLLKVLQPERTLASLPGGAELEPQTHAALLGLPFEVYDSELRHMREEASNAAAELLTEESVVAMVDRLPLRARENILVFGDSLTSDPQSWAVILQEAVGMRRGSDAPSWTINAVAGETTTHALVRGGVFAQAQPDWVLFLLGTNDARTQGSDPTKTLVHHEETARNVVELRRRVATETAARSLWVTPPAVDEERVAEHAGLARFGVRFRNEDVARVARIIRETDAPVIDAFAELGDAPAPALLMADGLHLSVEGHKRVALEVLRGWSNLR